MKDYGYPPQFPAEEDSAPAVEDKSDEPIIKAKSKGKKVKICRE